MEPGKLNDKQVRILTALLRGDSVMRGGDLARQAGVKNLKELADDLAPLISQGLVQATGPIEGEDVFYAVFAVRPSDMKKVDDLVRRASGS